MLALKNSGGFEGGGGGADPPHLQTRCSHHGFGRDSYALNKLARRQTNNKYVLCIMKFIYTNSIKYIYIYTYAFLLRFLMWIFIIQRYTIRYCVL